MGYILRGVILSSNLPLIRGLILCMIKKTSSFNFARLTLPKVVSITSPFTPPPSKGWSTTRTKSQALADLRSLLSVLVAPNTSLDWWAFLPSWVVSLQLVPTNGCTLKLIQGTKESLKLTSSSHQALLRTPTPLSLLPIHLILSLLTFCSLLSLNLENTLSP